VDQQHGAGRRGRQPVFAALAALLVLAIVLTVVAGTTSVLPQGLRRLILGTASVPSRQASRPPPPLATAPPPGAQAIPAPGPTMVAQPLDARAIAANVIPQTVDISAELAYDGGSSDGTGLLLTSSGLVLTDEHVIFEAYRIAARVGGRGRAYRAAVIGADPSDDVALLQLQGAAGLTPVAPGDPTSAAVGDPVVAIGNANGNGPASHSGQLTSLAEDFPVAADGDWPGAVVSSMLATDALVEPGQSGGPLVDSTGRVIALLESGDDQGIGYATPIDNALAIARQIAAGQPSPYIVMGLPAVLGVVTEDARGRTPGARVVTTHPGTPAESLGLGSGDVVTRLDDTDVTSALGLARMLVRYRPGDRAAVAWTTRLGARRSAIVRLAAGPGP